MLLEELRFKMETCETAFEFKVYQAMYLQKYLKFTYQQIATIQGISKSTVCRNIKQLKKEINNEEIMGDINIWGLL